VTSIFSDGHTFIHLGYNDQLISVVEMLIRSHGLNKALFITALEFQALRKKDNLLRSMLGIYFILL